jgi:hypothetical protein
VRCGGLIAAAALLASPAAGGERQADPRGPCASEDHRPWALLAAPPADADALRGQADRMPVFKVPMRWPSETWFRLGDAVMLCRSDAPLGRSCAGEWWQFGATHAGARDLTARDNWVCIAAR